MRKWLRFIRRIIRRMRLTPIDTANLDLRTIVFNFYLSQSLLLFIGITILFFQSQRLIDLFRISDVRLFLWALLFCGVATLVNMVTKPLMPDHLEEINALNIRMAKQLPVWHLMIVCIIAGFVEELIFRGALQHAIGIYWTSIIFTVVHAQYLRHWLLTGLVFLLSLSLGWIYEYTEMLLVCVAAHALYDLIMFCIVRYDIGGSYGGQMEREK